MARGRVRTPECKEDENGNFFKKCFRCGIFKNLKEDYFRGTGFLGFNTYCKECTSAYGKEYWIKNRERGMQRNKDNRLKKEYNLTENDLNQLIKLQENKCAICSNEMNGNREPHIDHDHETGIVRGLLCLNCNTGIGFFKDDINIMMLAIQYLIKGKE